MVLVRQRLVMLRRQEQLQRLSTESSDLRTLLSTSLAQRSRQTYLLLATRLMLLLSQRVKGYAGGLKRHGLKSGPSGHGSKVSQTCRFKRFCNYSR